MTVKRVPKQRRAPRRPPTPEERRDAAQRDYLTAWWDALELSETEKANVNRVDNDPDLDPADRYMILETLHAWPRIVLSIYEGELAAAQRDRKSNGVADQHGREEPSEIAERKVGELLGVGADRVRQICGEARQHIRGGWPSKPKVTVAEFLAYLRAPRPRVG